MEHKATDGDSGSRFNHKRNGNRNVLLRGPRGSIWHTQGAIEEFRQRETEPGQMPLLRFVGEVLQVSWAKAELVNSNQKSRDPCGVLSKVYTEKILERLG